jgi:uracil-DNA glycosylase
VPWYVSSAAKNKNACADDGKHALPYLHDFVSRLPDLHVVVVMGSFAQRRWFRYLIGCPDSRVSMASLMIRPGSFPRWS